MSCKTRVMPNGTLGTACERFVFPFTLDSLPYRHPSKNLSTLLQKEAAPSEAIDWAIHAHGLGANVYIGEAGTSRRVYVECTTDDPIFCAVPMPPLPGWVTQQPEQSMSAILPRHKMFAVHWDREDAWNEVKRTAFYTGELMSPRQVKPLLGTILSKSSLSMTLQQKVIRTIARLLAVARWRNDRFAYRKRAPGFDHDDQIDFAFMHWPLLLRDALPWLEQLRDAAFSSIPRSSRGHQVSGDTVWAKLRSFSPHARVEHLQLGSSDGFFMFTVYISGRDAKEEFLASRGCAHSDG